MRLVFDPPVRWLKRWPVLLLVGAGLAHAASFDSATVTRLENNVALGHHKKERPAAVADVVQAEDYLHTQSEARAELQFADHSIVRVGQNTVFSFDANSRTLSLQKGAMLFYIPPGSGGGQIKTPSLTAAVTGTVGMIATYLDAKPEVKHYQPAPDVVIIVVISGEIRTPFPPPSDVIHAGQALKFHKGQPDGIPYLYDPAGLTGQLMAWGGPLPEIPEVSAEQHPALGLPDTHQLDVNEWTQLNPTIRQILTEKPPQIPTTTKPEATPTPRPRPTPPPNTSPSPSPFRGGQ